MKIGTQIIYIPLHVDIKKTNHPHVCEGFVFGKEKDGTIPCRYWCRAYPDTLRTKSCSEMTPANRLVVKKTRTQKLVKETIKEIKRHGG